MGKVAFVFAGQGAQQPGMGQQLYDSNAAARGVFAMAERLRPGTLEQCFRGSAELLSQTVNTQPCLYTMDLACAMAAAEAGIKPDGVAGFSLGELAAVAFAGILSHEDGFHLVQQRAALMAQCTADFPSGMTAVLRIPAEQVEQICATVGNCYPVNYNCVGQTVVAFAAEVAEPLHAAVAKAGGRAMPLAVSGGFHSCFMDAAAAGLAVLLKGIGTLPSTLPVYANLTAAPYTTRVAELLSAQVNHPVQWQKTIENMVADGFDTFVEVGAGKILSGLIKKTATGVAVWNVCDEDTLKNTLAGVHAPC